MLVHLWACHPRIPRSIEIEKPRRGVERLFSRATVLLFSKGYAAHRGFADPAGFLRAVRREAPGADLVCTWGAQGAYALTRMGQTLHSPTCPPAQIVDTLGAGDTFNAGVIDALVSGAGLADALRQGCRLAGLKCGQFGLDGLGGYTTPG